MLLPARVLSFRYTMQPAGQAVTDLRGRYEQLERILHDCGSICIGYSGGVDSVYLAVAAVDVLGAANVLAVTGRSAAYPQVQYDTAMACVERFGIPHLEIDTDELADPRYAANPANRCYFCKSELWTKLWGVARDRGLAAVADGSNADDRGDYRPGSKAGQEQNVQSPLQEAGLTKSDVRELSRERGLPTWDQPASPCLSSRLPYGLAVTPARLTQVEAAENTLRAAGVREFRVRHHGDSARIEVAPEEMTKVLPVASAIGIALRAVGFQQVLLDVDGYRRGALNEGLPLVRLARAG